jgi:hypothetical protein
MRPLSFLFAALLGIVLAMIGPALAGPHPQAPMMEPLMQPALSAALEAEVADPALAAIEPAAAQPEASEAAVSVEEISRSILEVLGAADAA